MTGIVYNDDAQIINLYPRTADFKQRTTLRHHHRHSSSLILAMSSLPMMSAKKERAVTRRIM